MNIVTLDNFDHKRLIISANVVKANWESSRYFAFIRYEYENINYNKGSLKFITPVLDVNGMVLTKSRTGATILQIPINNEICQFFSSVERIIKNRLDSCSIDIASELNTHEQNDKQNIFLNKNFVLSSNIRYDNSSVANLQIEIQKYYMTENISAQVRHNNIDEEITSIEKLIELFTNSAKLRFVLDMQTIYINREPNEHFEHECSYKITCKAIQLF